MRHMDESKTPFVTMMTVVRNEEKYIGSAVRSLLSQNYPKDRLELLIIDGESTDRTVQNAREEVESFFCGSNESRIEVRYLVNKKKKLAAGWNQGILASRGDFVVRIDAHAQADPNLVACGVKILLQHPEVACAGGCIEARSFTEKGRLISDVLSSPFGVGNARFRWSNESGFVDTVAYGVYRKSIFEDAGYFNETFSRNQDNDMHGRIKQCGGKFYLDAEVKNTYYSRDTVKGMIKQANGNGRWNIITCKVSASREGLSIRHIVPLVFVTANLLLVVSCVFWAAARWMLLAMYVFYFGLAIGFAFKKTKNVLNVLKMCGLFWILHMSYGMGSLIELFRKPKAERIEIRHPEKAVNK